MALKKSDFIEIEFTGKTREGQVFDSNIKEELEKINPDYSKEQIKPFVYSLGQGMFLEGVDEFLIGKEPGKYNLELSPEKAFGKRNAEMVKRVPLKNFTENKINPVPGMSMNFDGKMGRILSVSGGRVLVDFNHPLSGKEVVYDVNVKRVVEDLDEKINSFNEFIFKKPLKFKVEDKKLFLEVESQLKNFVEMFKQKFKEIFDLDVTINELKEEQKPNSK